MTTMVRSLAILLSAGLVGACASPSALTNAPDRPDRPWSPKPDGASPGAAEPGFVLPPQPKLLPPASEGPEDDRTYTLADLIDWAQSHNPSTRVAWDEARRAALAQDIAQSAYRPRLAASVAGAYEHRNGHDDTPLGRLRGHGSDSGAVSALSLQWLLLDFGERAAIVDAAQQDSLIANIGFTAVHQQVIHDVSVAFYGHAAAQARLANAVKNVENAEIVLSAAQARYANGQGTVIEVAQARQARALAELHLVRARGARQDAYAALMVAIGASPLTQLRLADVGGRPLSTAMATSVEATIASAISRRPDVQAAFAAQQASQANVRAAQAAFRPKVFVSAGLAYSSTSLDAMATPAGGEDFPAVNLDGERLTSSVFAGVRVPLYDGGVRAATLARARAAADSAQARLTRTRQEAVREVVVADNALRTSLAAYEAAEALFAASRTTFDATLEAYRRGVGSLTELTLAQSQWLEASSARADAYSASLSAAAALALAAGALGSAPD